MEIQVEYDHYQILSYSTFKEDHNFPSEQVLHPFYASFEDSAMGFTIYLHIHSKKIISIKINQFM